MEACEREKVRDRFLKMWLKVNTRSAGVRASILHIWHKAKISCLVCGVNGSSYNPAEAKSSPPVNLQLQVWALFISYIEHQRAPKTGWTCVNVRAACAIIVAPRATNAHIQTSA